MYLHKPHHVDNVENNITNGEKRHMADILSELVTSMKECAASIDQTKLINSFVSGVSQMLFDTSQCIYY